MRKMCDVILAHSERKGKNSLKKLSGKKPLFICTIGTTETAKCMHLAVALVLTLISNRHFKDATGDVFGAGNELARLGSLIASLAVIR